MALSWCDLLYFISSIFIATTACGCIFENYCSTWFYAHFGWNIILAFNALSTYIVIFISLDRFVAVWFPMWFETITQPPFDITNRLVFATVLSFGLNVPYMVDATVSEKESFCNCSESIYENNCSSITYIPKDGFQNNFNQTWHKVFRYNYNVLMFWLPSVMLSVLNFSLVLAVISGRVKLPRAKAAEVEADMHRSFNTNKQETVLVATSLAMTASYVVMTIPIAIFLSCYAEFNDNRCTESTPKETLRHIGNIFQILEHILHSVYLFLINPSFRQGLISLFQCKKENHNSTLSNSEHPLGKVSSSMLGNM